MAKKPKTTRREELIRPGIQVKAIERNALCADRDFSEVRTYFQIESVAVHAEIGRRIAEADEAWYHAGKSSHIRPPPKGISMSLIVWLEARGRPHQGLCRPHHLA